jgi:hypothetical protein
MKYISFFYFTIFVSSIGCKQPDKKIDSNPWRKLILISEEDTRITINNDNDTSIINVFHSGSFFSPLPKNAKVKVDTLKAYFTMAEKDTLFSLAKDLIIHPAKTDKFCTEYVGSLKLVIDYGEQVQQVAVYSSVCNWNLLSDKTMKLHNMLKKRIKGVYLGENQN